MNYSYWETIKSLSIKTRKLKFQTTCTADKTTEGISLKGVRLTTSDAFTLTEGPTIYLADNVLNIAKLYVHQSLIPQKILSYLLESIEYNKQLHENITKMEEELQKKMQVKDNTDNSNSTSSKKKLKEKNPHNNEEHESLEENIRQLRKQIRILTLNPEFLPNSVRHQEKWTPDKSVFKNAFVSNVDAETVKQIMEMEIEESYKVLVLMGIGVLTTHSNKKYEELVKRLAQEQKLYLILTSTDYIYGTNYQFCHGFIGKDLKLITQQKLIQCMGRVGRHNIQQDYTVRFRSDEMIKLLFREPDVNVEAQNMVNIFCSDN
jgi:hypothetical protein